VVDFDESFTVEYITYKVPCGPHTTPAAKDGSALPKLVPIDASCPPGTVAPSTRVSFVSSTSVAMATLDDHDNGDEPHRFRTLGNINHAGAALFPELEELRGAAVHSCW
jgi:hypothetical protein